MVVPARRVPMFKCFAVWLLCLAGCLLGGRLLYAQPAAPVTLHYSERAPYQYTATDGRAAGLLIRLTAKVFDKAGIAVQWRSQPYNRSLMIIQANTGNDCSIGWFKTAEREAFAQFTLPIYRDRPQVGLARADFPVVAGISAEELLTDPATRLLLKQSFVYGAYLDALIARRPVDSIQRVSVEVPSMLMMLRARRADVLILSIEEVEFYAMQPDFPMQDFQVISLTDVPQGELRYLMCSQQLSPAVMQRVNRAIRKVLGHGESAGVHTN